ncbi:MAG: hypothetical protein WA738_01835 [Candidatus Angelobacter sp.]
MTCKSRLLIVLIFLAHIVARAENVKDEINGKYKKHILPMRAPFAHGDQRFDSSGQPLNPPPAAPWLV